MIEKVFLTATHKLGFINRLYSVCIAQDGDFCLYKIKKISRCKVE